MKKSFTWTRIAGAIALLILAVGCATTSSNENLLGAAGFQQRRADTPRKQELLSSLPKGQLTLVTWQGQQFYVQPDSASTNLAWVGRPAEFQAYQQLRVARQMTNDNLMAAQMNQNTAAAWRSAWGPGVWRWR